MEPNQAAEDALLMSDSLRGNIDGLDDEPTMEAVMVALVLVEGEPIVGLLRGILLGASPEVELRCPLTIGLNTIADDALRIKSIEIHHGDFVHQVSGERGVIARRIDEIDLAERMCTLGLHLGTID